jgi:hypothetical protein
VIKQIEVLSVAHRTSSKHNANKAQVDKMLVYGKITRVGTEGWDAKVRLKSQNRQNIDTRHVTNMSAYWQKSPSSQVDSVSGRYARLQGRPNKR